MKSEANIIVLLINFNRLGMNIYSFQLWYPISCVIHRSGAIHASHSGMWSIYGSYELPSMDIHL